MDRNTALSRFECLIDEERVAIRQCDVDAIVHLSEEKEALMRTLADNGIDRECESRFRAIVEGLRENSILLVFARNVARDVIQAVTAPSGAYSASGTTKGPAARRLSVVG